jgi:hypothetical protein
MPLNKAIQSEAPQRLDEFWAELRRKNIQLWVDGGSLHYKAPKGEMTPELIEFLRNQKEDLISHLTVKADPHGRATEGASSIFYEPIPQAPTQGTAALPPTAGIPPSYPLSASQRRLYILHQFPEIGNSYNITGATIIEGKLERSRLEETFQKLIQRHEAFRTTFEMMAGELVQKIHKAVAFEIRYLKAAPDQVEGIIKEFIQPFDFSSAPMLRVGLIELAADRKILIYDMSHLISDGVSLEILFKEFIKLYQGAELPELRIQYKDYTLWQNELLQSDLLKRQEEYWLKIFAGEIPILNLPTDYPRTGVMNFEGGSYSLHLSTDLTGKLKQLMQETRTTLFILLLASYNVFLSRLTGQEDIIIGTPVAGRRHADVQHIIGVFLNTLALRNYPQPGKCFGAFLNEVKQNAFTAFENQDYPYEALLEQLQRNRNMERILLFNIVINSQNMLSSIDNQTRGATLKFTPYEFERNTTTFDLIFYPLDIGDKIMIKCDYRTSLFKSDCIQYLMGEYLKLLEEIARSPNQQLKDYDFLNRRHLGKPVNKVRIK